MFDAMLAATIGMYSDNDMPGSKSCLRTIKRPKRTVSGQQRGVEPVFRQDFLAGRRQDKESQLRRRVPCGSARLLVSSA